MTKTKNPKGYSGGPKPSTERGKRRHAARDPHQLWHAKRVHEGGYVIRTPPTGCVQNQTHGFRETSNGKREI